VARPRLLGHARHFYEVVDDDTTPEIQFLGPTRKDVPIVLHRRLPAGSTEPHFRSPSEVTSIMSFLIDRTTKSICARALPAENGTFHSERSIALRHKDGWSARRPAKAARRICLGLPVFRHRL